MLSDFVSDVSLPCISKKKRANRLAKLKQSKLDVRREQWLSQVKNKEFKVDLNGGAESSPFSKRRALERNKSVNRSEAKLREEENEDVGIHDSDLESLMNSPIQGNQGHNDSMEAHCGSSCSGSSTRSECCSRSVSEEEEDGCLDNWEDVADALSAETRIGATCAEQQFKNQVTNQLNSEGGSTVCVSHMYCQAWRPDDAFRPRDLPSLSKEHIISLNSDLHNGRVLITCEQENTMTSYAASCPICCEDLDVTDSSFCPCPCGFRLCLFCHKRILEGDGRCPGCRKRYDTIDVNICFSR